MGKLADQVAALEAQVDGARPRWIVVGVAPFIWKIAKWVGDYYDVQEHLGTYRNASEAYGALVGMGLAKQVVR